MRALQPRKMKSQKCPILFEARVASTFPSLLASAANGSSVARGTSFLKDAMGTTVFAPGIRILDDARLVRGSASKPFDAEGQFAGSLALVDDGVLQTWLMDGRTATRLGLESNGRASRSTGGQPSPSSTNLWLEPGQKSAEELMREAGTGVLITSMFSSGVNMVTGDFSRGASGLYFENGEIAYPVSEITIAGNLKDISMGGAFVITLSVNQVSKGDIITISIPFTSGKKNVKRRARVMWTSGEGFAVEFL